MAPAYVEKTFAPLPGLQIRALNDARLTERIRVINEHCLAVKYMDNFYNTYVRNGLHEYNQLAFFHDILVGSITCRLEKIDEKDGQGNNNGEGSGGGSSGSPCYRLYIMTLCVLEAYRGLGIGSRMLQRVLSNVQRETTTRIVAVVLHAQVGSRVLAFYDKFAFTVAERIKEYYSPELDERDALLLRLVLHAMLRYRPTGVNRDSYISGVRQCGKYGAMHDVSKRRDGLPESIYANLRDEVLREERLRLCECEARARTRLALAAGAGGGKRIVGSCGGGGGGSRDAAAATMTLEQRSAEQYVAAEHMRHRHEALAQLYERDAAAWQRALRRRHLEPVSPSSLS